MRLVICAVGRFKGTPEAALTAEYARRSPWPLEVQEVQARRKGDKAAPTTQEARLLDAVCPQGAIRVALDARGRALDSTALARHLGAWRDEGQRCVAFLIGGADGLDPSIPDSAHLVLSLGAMTWPHGLARAMLAEQLYRAQMILTGHPYHRA